MNFAQKPPLGLKDRTPKKDPKHLARVAELPCCICEAYGLVQIGRTYVHHTICERWSQEKVPDRETIPLCHLHHQGELGVHTDKTAWQQEFGSDRDWIAATLDKLGL